MGEQLSNLEKQVDRILNILESDNKTKEKGLVEKVSSIERKVTEIITNDKILKAKIGSYGFIGGALFYAITWLLKLFIAKLI